MASIYRTLRPPRDPEFRASLRQGGLQKFILAGKSLCSGSVLSALGFGKLTQMNETNLICEVTSIVNCCCLFRPLTMRALDLSNGCKWRSPAFQHYLHPNSTQNDCTLNLSNKKSKRLSCYMVLGVQVLTSTNTPWICLDPRLRTARSLDPGFRSLIFFEKVTHYFQLPTA